MRGAPFVPRTARAPPYRQVIQSHVMSKGSCKKHLSLHHPYILSLLTHSRGWYFSMGPSFHGQLFFSAARLTSLMKNSSISRSFFSISRLWTLRPDSNLGSSTSRQNCRCDRNLRKVFLAPAFVRLSPSWANPFTHLHLVPAWTPLFTARVSS